MADIIPFPERKFTPPPKGWCATCLAEVDWPRTGAWPESCPYGCTPFIVTSWPTEPYGGWFPDLTN